MIRWMIPFVIVSCSSHSGEISSDASLPVEQRDAALSVFSALQKDKAEKLTSIWENSTTLLQYAYCEDIGDGRGFTSGRAGFCSGTGDAVLVAKCLDAVTSGSNPLHKYIPALTALETKYNDSGQDQANTSTLTSVGNYCKDWTLSFTGATSVAFKKCQDDLVAELYFQPAAMQAAKWGLTKALSIAALYDANINHGGSGVEEFITGTNTDVGNASQTPAAQPLSVAAESLWLDKFLSRRLDTLKANADWKFSVDRAVQYQSMRSSGNWNLSAEIITDAKAVNMYPGAGYIDSGYPRCIIAGDGTVSGEASCTTASQPAPSTR
jgi:chitosanase